ncbi:T-complex protein 1 subunit eta, putative [Perkinsus marinus ATCC 50983]|uniref:T-complex protein 1 subunit eta n=2 Tax=Perkinsus marinus (strain ATCC 50983 / TXsc) TaxID=423536 RepID=C5LLS4_PERM5|nr:T-complex protein 1 subunit eta, putative [Perkinsus marinus ATCC 50983]EER02296.1 T-complex protein 1 subunit eta, putative [Perkinsus marinus ATCC 50983]|eukprot:XP_002769578.1 T-complex protein 1 subunit eta, putative [Perkinsus marinus ATCC 50983]
MTSLRPNIILLKQGTDSSQGIPQIISNINACEVIADIVRTTLGPRGMDKLIHSANREPTITNDGATVMSLLNISHPAAKLMSDISKAQDDEVGDGTTSVVLLAAELLKEAKMFLEEGLPPRALLKGYRKALELALDKLEEVAVDLTAKAPEEKRAMLVKCAETTLNSKLVSGQKKFFSDMVVSAVLMLDQDSLPVNMIGFKKVPGGSLTESRLVDGVAFKKTFSYAGFEQQPKYFKNPKILLLNLELELKAEKDNAEVRISNPDEYQEIVDAEWNVIYEKLDNIAKSGAQVVLSRLPIGDLATQYFADRNIFCAGRVDQDDMNRTLLAVGGSVQTTVNGLTDDVLGTCGNFEEIQIGNERYNIFHQCPQSKSATIILRGGAAQFIEEAERSLHDAVMVVRRALKCSKIVGGGGAIELELSRYLREYSRTCTGADQAVINYYARALECIPRTLAKNSGADATDLLNKLRYKHAEGLVGRWYGVDCYNCDITETVENFIWEPVVVKRNALAAATEAACMILSIDETVTNPKSEQPGGGKGGMPMGKGRGMMGGKGMGRR